MYGRANQAALRTMLTTIFERQPKYTEDLVNAAKGLVQVSNHLIVFLHICVCVCVCVTVCVCMDVHVCACM